MDENTAHKPSLSRVFLPLIGVIRLLKCKTGLRAYSLKSTPKPYAGIRGCQSLLADFWLTNHDRSNLTFKPGFALLLYYDNRICRGLASLDLIPSPFSTQFDP